jgi:hypothetical protein
MGVLVLLLSALELTGLPSHADDAMHDQQPNKFPAAPPERIFDQAFLVPSWIWSLLHSANYPALTYCMTPEHRSWRLWISISTLYHHELGVIFIVPMILHWLIMRPAPFNADSILLSTSSCFSCLLPIGCSTLLELQVSIILQNRRNWPCLEGTPCTFTCKQSYGM